MTRRTRVFIGILLVYALGVGFLMYRLLADIDPRYRESAEESLVEAAHLLATVVEQHSAEGRIDAESLRPVFRSLYARSFSARIFDFEKTGVELQALVIGRDGLVLFDSLGQREGEDFSQWRDVRAAMAGEYRARTTPRIPGDELSSVMYVSAPVRSAGEIVGVVSVGKPVQSLNQFVAAARRKTLLVGATAVAAVAVLVLILSLWLVRPFGLIADYVRYVRSQRSFSLPRLGRRALGTLGAAYDEMRDALAGRHYVADYVQTLTHELKSPLSAIRGAAELLHEREMPAADRERFVANIERETARIQELVDRMMELAALESRRALERTEPVSLAMLLQDSVASAAARSSTGAMAGRWPSWRGAASPAGARPPCRHWPRDCCPAPTPDACCCWAPRCRCRRWAAGCWRPSRTSASRWPATAWCATAGAAPTCSAARPRRWRTWCRPSHNASTWAASSRCAPASGSPPAR